MLSYSPRKENVSADLCKEQEEMSQSKLAELSYQSRSEGLGLV